MPRSRKCESIPSFSHKPSWHSAETILPFYLLKEHLKKLYLINFSAMHYVYFPQNCTTGDSLHTCFHYLCFHISLVSSVLWEASILSTAAAKIAAQAQRGGCSFPDSPQHSYSFMLFLAPSHHDPCPFSVFPILCIFYIHVIFFRNATIHHTSFASLWTWYIHKKCD
jgi:hypothetical protein